VKRAPKEIEPYIQGILGLAQVAVVFDPNYDYSAFDDAPMEEEEDGWSDDGMDVGGAGEDDDDSSWKVRRAAVKLIDSIIVSRPDMLREVYQKYAKLLASRFKERDDNVKINIFDTFQTLLKSSILNENQQSIDLQFQMAPSLERKRSASDEIADLVPFIVEQLVKQLRESKNQKVRTSAMHTLAACSHVQGKLLGTRFDQLLPEFQKIVSDSSAFDLILDILIIFRRLFKIGGEENAPIFQSYQSQIFDIIQKGISHEYSKVVSEALRVAGIYVNILRNPQTGDIAPSFAGVVQPLYAAIRTKLQKADIDQEIKECSIVSMANFIGVCHKQLQPN
jgi:cullin-associated NEDD8-dissociated protein 1